MFSESVRVLLAGASGVDGAGTVVRKGGDKQTGVIDINSFIAFRIPHTVWSVDIFGGDVLRAGYDVPNVFA